MDESISIYLNAGEEYLTGAAGDAYQVVKGSARVFMAEMKRSQSDGELSDSKWEPSGRKKYICEIKEKGVFPSFAYNDREGRAWRFAVTGKDNDSVGLLKMSGAATKPLYRRFSAAAALDGFESEGFENSLVSFWDKGAQPEAVPAHESDAGERISIETNNMYLTKEAGAVYKVVSGSVLVFMMKMKQAAPVDGEPPEDEWEPAGERTFICEVKEKGNIPSFAFRDIDFRTWRFAFIAKNGWEKTELIKLPEAANEDIYRSFLNDAKIYTFDREGYENSLAACYDREKLEDSVRFTKEEQEDVVRYDKQIGLIISAFTDGGARVDTDNLIYNTVVYCCSEAGIDVVDERRLNSICGKDVTVPNIAKASNFLCRDVVLESGWFKEDCGPIISDIDGECVACVARGRGKYKIHFSASNRTENLTAEIAERVNPKAYSIGRSLPARSLTGRDLFSFCRKSLTKSGLPSLVLLALASTLIGMLLPTLNQKMYDEYIPIGNFSQMAQLCTVIATFMIGNLLFGVVKSLFEMRINGRVGYDLQNAAYFRIFRLPEKFFRDYDSADLGSRLMSVSGMANSYAKVFTVTGLAFVFSFLYLYRMFKYSSKLSWAALLMVLVYSGVLYLLATRSNRYEAIRIKSDGEADSRLFQFLNAVEKIRMAGAEEQAAYEYMKPAAEKERAALGESRITSFSETLPEVISFIFSMVLYFIIVKKKLEISTGNYIAFDAAFGLFSASLLSLVGGLIELFQLKPVWERCRPIFATAPEDDGAKEIPGTIKGAISLNNIVFSYKEGGQNVINGLSLDIRPGEYVGIVGASGCGKSTLLKLLLGFEKPNDGLICYDNMDLQTLDKRSLRKQLGVVLQNGRLISGSIYENITITAPHATLQQVKDTVASVGLKEDIEQMPMGLQTVLSENTGTISGGQLQRILIARAIINRPPVLFFDEATSALDNITQAAVCASLDKMHSTRIVIAHRLSTIKTCDRIIVMDAGKIIQQGSYEQLMQDERGLFYQLAKRQIAESEVAAV